MPQAVAINVAANTNLPGVRGPIYADGRFEYVPIPEREPVDEPVPTYADLDLRTSLPDGHLDTPVHLDPAFAEYAHCDRYTYGDEHGIKAGPLTDLSAGDYVFFYATLSATDKEAEPTADDESATTASDETYAFWIAPEWGAYVIGQFRLARDPLSGEEYRALPAAEQEWFAADVGVGRESAARRRSGGLGAVRSGSPAQYRRGGKRGEPVGHRSLLGFRKRAVVASPDAVRRTGRRGTARDPADWRVRALFSLTLLLVDADDQHWLVRATDHVLGDASEQ